MAVEALVLALAPNSKLVHCGEMTGGCLNRGRDSQPDLSSEVP